MKLATCLLLLAAVAQAAQVGGGQEKNVEEKNDKRELTEGNAGLEKRAPLLPTASSPLNGRIEYANTQTTAPDKSPPQQNYVTPVPNIAKVSDLLTAQGPSYQDAIASHLYSPISIYQTRFGPPTTYEVSAPVSSNLAYSEHRLSLPSPNTLQYSAKSQKLVKPVAANYEQPQVLIQQSYEQNLPPVQQVTSSPFINHEQIQYNTNPQQVFPHQQQLQYTQEQPNQFQAGIAFRQGHQFSQGISHQQPEQRDLKSQPISSGVLEKQVVQQVFNDKQQPALSYARFSVNQGAPSYQPNQLQQAHQLPQPQALFQAQQLIQAQQQQPQHFIQTQPQPYQPQPLAQISYQLQHPTKQLPQLQFQAPHEARQSLQSNIQNQFQHQSQIQYQEQPQYLYQQLQEQALHRQRLLPQSSQDQSQYINNIQPQEYQFQQPQLFNEKPDLALSNQAIPEQSLKQAAVQPQIQNLGYQGLPAALPTFPPVQYFGKLANSLLSGYHQ